MFVMRQRLETFDDFFHVIEHFGNLSLEQLPDFLVANYVVDLDMLAEYMRQLTTAPRDYAAKVAA